MFESGNYSASGTEDGLFNATERLLTTIPFLDRNEGNCLTELNGVMKLCESYVFEPTVPVAEGSV